MTVPARRAVAAPAADDPAGCADTEIVVAGIALVADLGGVIYWPLERALVVADLHLEKGSAFAARGMLLPPYDTEATLARLGEMIARYAPRLVIALGDNFHDGGGPARLSASDRATLTELQRGRDWIWIAGNHDPEPAEGIGGAFADMLALGPLAFRHEPTHGARPGEIAGHLHPSARIVQRGRAIVRKCFAADATRMLMPSFGAYTGGLDIGDRAFTRVFGHRDFTAHLIGDRRFYRFAAARCAG